MDTLQQLHWYCIESTTEQISHRSIFVDNIKRDDLDIGDEIELNNENGTVIATSAMGITVFDLFNEIITEEDMKRFLHKNNVVEEYFGAGLILRTFLQMIDMVPNSESKPISQMLNNNTATLTEDFSVKLEEEDSYDELIEYSDDDQSVGILSESDDSQGSKSSRQLPDLMRTCKTKKCGCGKVFSSIEAKRQHYIDERIYECKRCSECLPSEQSLRNHRAKEHKMAQTRVRSVRNSDGLYTCRVTKKSCLELFETIEKRDEHEKDVKHFSCKSCSLDFSIFSDWQKHRNDDKNCLALTCQNCHKNFQDSKAGYKSSNFKDHVQSCQNLRSFICDVCGKAFNHERRLRLHREVHTESREQKRLLNQLNNQARSEAIRKNPRRFNCESCNRSYTTNQKLKFHQLSAHGDGAKFACPYCPMMLMNPSTLNSHIKNVHEKGPIIARCEICNRGFHTKTKASQCRRQHLRNTNFRYQEAIESSNYTEGLLCLPSSSGANSLSALLLDQH